MLKEYQQLLCDGVGNSNVQNKIVLQAGVLLWLADIHDPGLELIIEMDVVFNYPA